MLTRFLVLIGTKITESEFPLVVPSYDRFTAEDKKLILVSFVAACLVALRQSTHRYGITRGIPEKLFATLRTRESNKNQRKTLYFRIGRNLISYQIYEHLFSQ